MLTIDCNLLGVIDGEQVLDIGCGQGRHSSEACQQINCRVWALDIEEETIKKAKCFLELMDEKGQFKGNWMLIRADAMSLPFKDASFDKIICSEVLEHLPDDQQAMREMQRVLKDDGVVAISVPTYLTEAICWKLSNDYHNNPGGHVIRYKHALHSTYWLLRCLFGRINEKALIPSLYYKFLVWDIKTKSKPIRLLESLINPFFSKSTVFYAH